jgi:hypothetical protein
MNRKLQGVLAAAALTVTVAGVAWAGDLADVKVTQAKDPVNGVRLIEISGMTDGRTQKVWVMISEQNYAKLVGCKRTQSGAGPALQYSDKSAMVNVVVCD